MYFFSSKNNDDLACLLIAQEEWVLVGVVILDKRENVCLINFLTQELLARGGDAGQQAEARLLARTEVDARRELHNGTNNAGKLGFSVLNFGFNL